MEREIYDEDDVVSRARFVDFYAAEYPQMVRLARLLTGSDTTCEEIAQEAFIRLHQQPNEPANRGGYLRVVVVNLCRDQARRRNVERRLDVRHPGPLFNAEIDETWAALRLLPEAQRAVVVLRFHEDLSEADIAGVLGCRVGTVKSRLHRALATLRKDLG